MPKKLQEGIVKQIGKYEGYTEDCIFFSALKGRKYLCRGIFVSALLPITGCAVLLFHPVV